VVPDEMYVYPRSYGNESDVEIIFPVGAVEEECRLTVQVELKLILRDKWRTISTSNFSLMKPMQWGCKYYSKRW
jgi:hypothetical protein